MSKALEATKERGLETVAIAAEANNTAALNLYISLGFLTKCHTMELVIDTLYPNPS